MSARRRKVPASVDPLLRPCPACGAPKGKGCQLHIDAKVVTKATRLVHADRLEQVEPMQRKE